MILFVSCGRGLDNFVKEELLQIPEVTEAYVFAEGKILFNLLCASSDNLINEYCKLTNCLSERQSNYSCISGFQASNLNLNSNVFLKFFQLKLVEKLYLIVMCQKFGNDREKVCECILEDLKLVDFASFMHLIKTIKLTGINVTPHKQCSNPGICPAFHEYRIEKDRQIYNRKRKFQDLYYPDTDANKNKEYEETHSSKQYSNASNNTDKQSSFRVSCRIRGSWRNTFNPQKLTRNMESIISEQHNDWEIDKDLPLLDLFININDDCFIAGLSLTQKPLSLRPYVRHITLRSTICYLMIKLAKIESGFSILDPMCGCGSILIEAASCITNLLLFGCDSSENQLMSAQCNLRDVERVDLILSDVTRCPMLSESIDAVVCDFPFGKKHQAKNSDQLILITLKECERVLRPSSRLVMLVSDRQNGLIETILKGVVNLSLLERHRVSLGITTAWICVFHKETFS